MKRNGRFFVFLRRALCLSLAILMMFCAVSCKKKVTDPNEIFRIAVRNYVNEQFDAYSQNKWNDIAQAESVNISLQPELSDAFLAMFGAELPFSLEFVNDIKITLNEFEENKISTLYAAVLYKDKALLTSREILDIESLVLYASVDPILDKYVKIDISELFEGTGIDPLELVNANLSLPDAKKLEEIANEYVELILAKVEGVVMQDSSVELSGITAETRNLVWSVSANTLLNTSAEILDKLAADQRVKDIYLVYASEEDYADFVAELKDVAGDLRASEDGTDALAATFTLEIDGNDDILQFDADFYDIEGNSGIIFEASWKGVETDGKLAYECVIAPQDEPVVKLAVDSTEEKGKANGTLAVSYDGKQLFNVKFTDYDTKTAKEGKINGTFVVKAGAGLSNLPDMDASTSAMLGMFSLRFEVKTVDEVVDCFASLEMNDSNFFGFKIQIRDADTYTAAIPENCETDVENWVMGLDINALVRALEESELPDDVVNTVKSLIFAQ